MFAVSYLGLPDHFLSDLIAVAAFGVILVVMVGFGCKIADLIWRHLDLEKQVHAGNVSAGIVMASLILGLCYAMATVISAILG